MQIFYGLVLVAFLLSSACAGRTATSTRSAPAAAPNAQTAAPLTVQEYESHEKNIGTTFPELQKHLMARQGAEASKDAQKLTVLFGDVERFWAQHNKADAVKVAQQARTLATEAAGVATAGDFAKATRVAASMEAACKQCHGTYREMDASGGFRIKAGALTR